MVNLEALQARHNEKMRKKTVKSKSKNSKSKRLLMSIHIMPRTNESMDCDSNHHNGIKRKSKLRPVANKPTWKT